MKDRKNLETNKNSKNGKIKLVSFGFKYGLPTANFYFDVSFTKNPARQKQWGMFGKIDKEMIDFVLSQKDVEKFISLVVPVIEYVSTLDSYQIIAFGCNAGRHRSPPVVNEIANRLADQIDITVEHRDLPENEAFIYELRHSKK